MLDKFSNVHVEIAARIGELGRQPRMSARFFDKYQDRILFGTDADSRQVLAQDMYRIYYRFLEPWMSTSTTRRRVSRRRVGGESTVLACPNRSSARCITRMPSASSG